MNRLRALVTLGALVFGGIDASGVVRGEQIIVYDNWQNQAGQQQFQGSNNWVAQSFKTGSKALNLDTVSVMLNNGISGTPASIAVEIYSSTGSNLPGTSLHTVAANATLETWYDSNSGDNPNGVKESFFHGLDYNLAANTQYFVVVKNLGSANLGIKYPNVATVTDVSPVPTAYFSVITGDSGSSWSTGNPSTGGYALYLKATVVPEPPATMLCAIGGLGAALVMRQRRAG